MSKVGSISSFGALEAAAAPETSPQFNITAHGDHGAGCYSRPAHMNAGWLRAQFSESDADAADCSVLEQQVSGGADQAGAAGGPRAAEDVGVAVHRDEIAARFQPQADALAYRHVDAECECHRKAGLVRAPRGLQQRRAQS